MNKICNLPKKIEPDSKNLTYLKTVLDNGYKSVRTVHGSDMSFI